MRSLSRGLCLGVLVLVLGAGQAQAASILYATAGQTGTDDLWILDPSTGATSSTVGNVVDSTLGANVGYSITGLASHPATGVLFGITSNRSGLPGYLLTINTTTAAGTVVGSTNTLLSDLAFSPTGVLYAVGREGFGTVNTTTAAFTLISAGFNGGGLTFDAVGMLYYSGFANQLSTVNPVTGAILTTTPTGLLSTERISALAYNPDTAAVFGSSRNYLYNMTIPALIGGPGNTGNLDSIEFAPTTVVPEPGTLMLLATGLGVVARKRIASRRR